LFIPVPLKLANMVLICIELFLSLNIVMVVVACTKNMPKIKIEFEGAGSLNGEIDESLNPRTANAIITALPIQGKAMTWGEEIYAIVSFKVPTEMASININVGDIAYWPDGPAICFFYGRTPSSKSDAPEAFSPVNVVGKFEVKKDILKAVKNGTRITMRRR